MNLEPRGTEGNPHARKTFLRSCGETWKEIEGRNGVGPKGKENWRKKEVVKVRGVSHGLELCPKGIDTKEGGSCVCDLLALNQIAREVKEEGRCTC